MKVLVTGANGFVGRSLCEQLMDLEYSVRGALRRAGLPEECRGFEQVVVGDIGPVTNWEKALAGVDCVVHLAARVHVMNDRVDNPLAEFRRVNLDGTIRLAEQACSIGIQRFVYLSTIKVNGDETCGTPFSAADQPFPLNPYGVSKAEAEDYLLEKVGRDCMEVVIIRPPLVYGSGVKANFQKMMQCLVSGIPLPLGAIHNKRSLVAVENLVGLIVTCIEHPAAANQVFLAGDGEDLSTTELLQRLGVALGKPVHLLPVPQWLVESGLRMLGKGDVAQRLCSSLQVDISKARDLLGWRPSISVDEGLKKTADWYLKQKK